MINLRNSPFLWLALTLLLAFWAMDHFSITLGGRIKLICMATCMLSIVLVLLRYMPSKQFISSVFIFLLVFAAGVLRMDVFTKELFVGKPLSSLSQVEGVFEVIQLLKNKGTSISLRCERRALFGKEKTASLTDDQFLLVSIKTDKPLQFFPGDVIRTKGWLSAISGPYNPNAFDARAHYKTLGIRHQVFCKSADVTLEQASKTSLTRITAQWQFALSSLVREQVSPQVAQLTNALVWGDRADMDTEIVDAFAASGAIHVLSVSGMHVAIIYSMLMLMFGAPGNGPLKQRVFRFGCYSMAIMLYVFLTGASPAALRAGLMILLYLLGKAMGWNTPVWNLLGFAAFLMMWLNPYAWLNIGFQLSFLAMAGLLLFAKPIIRSVTCKHLIVHRIWEITAVSISAQIFILPVLLGQFHQFPLTFIMSSIVAAPAAYIVMGGAILNIILSCMGIDQLWVMVDWAGVVFIDIMQWMAGLNPLMYFSLPSAGSLMLMTMAVLFSFAVVFKWNGGRKVAYLAGIAAFVVMGCHRQEQWSTGSVVVYHSYKGLIIDIIDDGRCISIIDNSLTPGSIEFATRGYRCEKDVISVTEVDVRQAFEVQECSYDGYLLDLSDQQMLIWPADSLFDLNGIHASLVLVNSLPDPATFKDFICHNADVKVIMPVHLNRSWRRHLIKYFTQEGVSFHDIETSGYFNISL